MTMNQITSVYRWTGILGIIATAVFLAKTFIPLPSFPHLLLCMTFGPLVIAGTPGMAKFLCSSISRCCSSAPFCGSGARVPPRSPARDVSSP